MMKKNSQGFTLMEILAVLLVIAVIASFAMPLVKSVRREIRYQKAKAAAAQLAEAVRSFYTNTKGCLHTGSFVGADAASGVCPTEHAALTGIPGQCTEDTSATVVFGCNYISPKIFLDLPYTFEVKDPRTGGVLVTGKENVGSEDEEDPRMFYVYRDMTILEEDK